MTPFDPYHKWLAIPPEEQPPNHYRLLALPLFETDADVIDTAAEQRTVFLRTFHTGPNSELAARLLNEISAARVCLLDGKSKARYDTQLRATLEPVSEDDPLAFTTEELAAVASGPSTRQRSRGGKPVWKVPWAIPAAAGGSVVVLLLMMLLFGSGGTDNKEPGKTTEQTILTQRRVTGELDDDLALPSPPVPVPGCRIHLACDADDIVVHNGNPAIRNVTKEDDFGELYGVVPVKKDGRPSLCFTGSRDAKVVFRNRELGTAHTMSMWVLPKEKGDILTLANYGGAGATFYVNRWRTASRELGLEIYQGTGFASSDEVVEFGRWQHVAFSVDFKSGIATLFRNGKSVGKREQMKPYGTGGDLYFGYGAGNLNAEFTFKGYMSDIRVFDRALSVEEVRQLYEFESGGTAAATASDKLYLATLRPVSVGAYRFSSNGLGYAPPKMIKVNGIPSSFGLTLHPRLATNRGYAKYNTPLSYQLLAGAVALEDIVQDSTPTLTFRVTAQGKTLWESAGISKQGKVIGFCVPVAEISQFELVSTCNSANSANAVWLDPVLLKSTGGKSLDQIAKEQQARWLKKDD